MGTETIEFVITDSYLFRVCDPNDSTPKFGCIDPHASVRKDVMRDHIIPHINAEIIIGHLCDVWVLYGHKGSNGLVRSSEKKWEELVTVEEMEKLNSRGHIILGLAMVTESEKYVGIDVIETYVKGLNLGQYIIQRLGIRLGRPCIPLDVTPNITYWKKHLDEICRICDDVGIDPFAVIKGFDGLIEECEKDRLEIQEDDNKQKTQKSKKRKH